MPDVYGVTMFDNQVLSPFNRNNMRLYRYSITTLTDNRTEITFAPKRRNTQLISGSAVVDSGTGRIIRIKFHGEYDMLDFNVDATMGKNGMMSLMPKTCDIDAKFHFIGNKLRASYHAVYDNLIVLPDSIVNSHDRKLMAEIRPEPLPSYIRDVYAENDSLRAKADTTRVKKEESVWKRVLWGLVRRLRYQPYKGQFRRKQAGGVQDFTNTEPAIPQLQRQKRRHIQAETERQLPFLHEQRHIRRFQRRAIHSSKNNYTLKFR